MKVSELIKRLQEMPQELFVYIKDADEGCLLRLDADDVEALPADKMYGYSFPRVEIGGDYHGRDGQGRRMEADVNNLPDFPR